MPERIALPVRLRWIILAAGMGLLVLSLLADALRLSASGFSRGQWMVALAGLLLIAIAGLWERTLKAYQSAGVLLLNTVVLLLLIEVGAGAYSWLISRGGGEDEQPITQDPRQQISYYQAQDWSAEYFAEVQNLEAEHTPYIPFILWSSPSYTGQLIKVDEDHLRQTPNADCRTGSYTVFMFGGSTMFGVGSPDWGTIAAYLQAALDNTHEGAVCVVNYGQSAFVSTQEVFQLILALKAGEQPDLVIFYDGLNDVYAGYQNGSAASHHNQADIVGKLNADEVSKPFREEVVDQLEAHSYTVRLLRDWFRKEEVENQHFITYRTMNVDRDELTGEIIQNYLSNYQVVAALAQSYQFEFAFFWQPVIWRSKPLTSEEQALVDPLDPDMVALYDAVYDALPDAFAQYENVYNLSNIFEGEDQLLWGDWLHVTPVGNQIIAEKILDALSDKILS